MDNICAKIAAFFCCSGPEEDLETGGHQQGIRMKNIQHDVGPAYRAQTPPPPLSNRDIYGNIADVWRLKTASEQYDEYVEGRVKAEAAGAGGAGDAAGTLGVVPTIHIEGDGADQNKTI